MRVDLIPRGWVASLTLWSVLNLVECDGPPLLKDVTKKVFGSDPNDLTRLPVAFGDFNGDKMTDLFVLPNDRTSVTVLLAKEDTFSVTSEPKYFGDTASTASGKGIVCHINNVVIEAVIPGDFDGDGGMDVLVVTVPEDPEDGDNPYESFVLWGDHDVKEKRHRLVCQEKRPETVHKMAMAVHPMTVDANADYTADLFGAAVVDGNLQAGAWIFKKGNRTLPPEWVALNDAKKPVKISRPFHSNAYLDLDGDGNSDLFVTAEDHFEVWLNDPQAEVAASDGNKTSKVLSYSHAKDLVVDGCHDYNKCILGQVSFVDFDFDGVIDALLPVCYDGVKCTNGTILSAPLTDLTAKDRPFKPFGPRLMFQAPEWHFAPYGPDETQGAGIYSPLTMRFGDFNLDGYPDFLVRLKTDLVPPIKARTHLFLNVEWTGNDIEPNPPKGTRGFMLMLDVMDSVVSGPDEGEGQNSDDEVTLATFFDWHEDGIEDIIVVRNKTVAGRPQVTIGAFTNATLASDAYFVKIIVLSGVCNGQHSCPGGHVEVPYGTNMPGQTICYRTQKSGQSIGSGYDFVETCAAQLPVSSHSRLMLPYNTFGLGMSPNFLETLYVNVTNATDHSRSKTWAQIIPNSQLYVIPYPPTREGDWAMKLFITPSKSIAFTAIALTGLCGLIVLIILFLHWREKVQDRKEKLQEANRFHFDAM